MTTTTTTLPCPTPARVEAAIERAARVPRDLRRAVDVYGQLEVWVRAFGRSDSDDDHAAKARNWARHARRIEACGGEWHARRSPHDYTRPVWLPLSFTGEALSTLLALVDEYGDLDRPTTAICRPRYGESRVWDVGRRRAYATDPAEVIARRAAPRRSACGRSSRLARTASCAARGRRTSNASTTRPTRSTAGASLAWSTSVGWRSRQVERSLALEHERLATLPAGIRRAIENEAARAAGTETAAGFAPIGWARARLGGGS